ncbi:hypothetical protein D3C80_1520570 [compost metagenome]
MVIAPKIVGLEEQEDPATALPADGGLLLGGRGPRQQQRRPGGASGGDPHPALAGLARLVERVVFQQGEAEPLGEEGDGLVVVGHQQGQGAKVLRHGDVPRQMSRAASALIAAQHSGLLTAEASTASAFEGTTARPYPTSTRLRPCFLAR